MVPEQDPIVVYAMVTALIVAVAVGIFFASPLRILLTGPDDPYDAEPSPEGPWSTAEPKPDDNWPRA